ncbi:MAG TPA: hypothetical protein ENO01_01565 [Candidatus Marinimicrobia bacterium]|nr:hypothetical protein [Candidatus Neomarinimicrobiota bacterium]
MEWHSSSSDPYFSETTRWTAGPVDFLTRLYVLPDQDKRVIVWEGRTVNTSRHKVSFRIEPIFDFARPSVADYGNRKVQFLADEYVFTAGFTDGTADDVADGIFSRRISLSPSETKTFTLLIVISENQLESESQWDSLSVVNIRHKAQSGWDKWLASGVEPHFMSAEDSLRFRSNIVSVKALNLNGAVPADITGQFVTNGLPQLYPRDAFMTARMFLETGHYDEVKQIVDFWSRVPMKFTGEWYARYDAYGRATDGGSGARFDVPEWDSNGYYTSLIYEFFLRKRYWIGSYNLVKDLMTFVELHMDEKGLVEEGGIVEWPAYLPSTNMSLSAAFHQASFIARWRNETQLARRWTASGERMEKGLVLLWDSEQKTYNDLRNNQFNWNTSTAFGWIWGFDDHLRFQLSTEYWWNNCRKTNNGIQYFNGEGYGDDMFGFTTGALAQYYAAKHRHDRYLKLKEWFELSSNHYGLIPERVHYPEDEEIISEASPLTWCSAEYVMVLLEGARHLILSDDIERTEKYAIELCRNNIAAQIPFQDTLSRSDCLDYLDDDSFWKNNFSWQREKIRSLFQASSLRKSEISIDMEPYMTEIVSDSPYQINFQINAIKPAEHMNIRSRYESSGWQVRTSGIFNSDKHFAVRVIPGIPLPTTDHYGYFMLEWMIRTNDMDIPLYFPVHYKVLAPYMLVLTDSLVTDKLPLHLMNRSLVPVQIKFLQDTLETILSYPPGFDGLVTIVLPESKPLQDTLNVTLMYGSVETEYSFHWIPCVEIDLAKGWEFSPKQNVNQCFMLSMKNNLWENIDVPSLWEDAGYPGLDGTFWYRRSFSLPDSLLDKRIWLEMGAVDDEDETYINCTHIGTTAGWNRHRRYPIPTNRYVIRRGQSNFIQVRVTDYGQGGGIWKKPVRFLVER